MIEGDSEFRRIIGQVVTGEVGLENAQLDFKHRLAWVDFLYELVDYYYDSTDSDPHSLAPESDEGQKFSDLIHFGIGRMLLAGLPSNPGAMEQYRQRLINLVSDITSLHFDGYLDDEVGRLINEHYEKVSSEGYILAQLLREQITVGEKVRSVFLQMPRFGPLSGEWSEGRDSNIMDEDGHYVPGVKIKRKRDV